MTYLWIVTALWSFSFSLIGVYLSGNVDNYFAVFCRILLAGLFFLPFIRWRQVPAPLAINLMVIGGIQIGAMYLFFYNAFLFLTVPEVIFFTVFTPVYVTLIHDALQRRFTIWYLVTATGAVIGAAIIRYNQVTPDFWIGFLLVQAANICFALGQVLYKLLMQKNRLDERRTLPQHAVFGFFYFGALIISFIGFLLWGDISRLPVTTEQWAVLAWLGIMASGLGYFLWNKGATQVDPGTLSIMNNALVPAGLLVNILIWNQDVELVRFSLGGGLILLSLWLNQTWAKKRVPASSAALQDCA